MGSARKCRGHRARSDHDTNPAVVEWYALRNAQTGSRMFRSLDDHAIQFLSEVCPVLAVLGVLFFQPLLKLEVMSIALLSAIGCRVVAKVQLPTPLLGSIGRRSVRQQSMEDRNVPWF